MVKKKRVGRKPAISATEVKITGEDLPLSQIEGVEPKFKKNSVAAQMEKEDQKGNKEGNMDNAEASSKWLTPKKKAMRNTEDKYVNVEVLYESSQLVHCKVKQLVKEKHLAYMTAKERLAQVRSQQSKINWIKFNDENSSYFHAVMRKRRLENRITTFTKGDTVVDDFEEVKILNIRDNMDEARLCQAVKGGKFSAKRFYNLSIEVAKAEYAKASWDKLIVPKHRFVFWQILNSQLLTRDYLGCFISIQNDLCPVCEAEVEMHEHLFFNCIFTKQVIGAVMEWLGCFSWPRSNLELLNWCKNLNQQPQLRVLNTVIAATMYSIWKNRNSCIFYLCCATPRRVSLDVRKTVQLRLLASGFLFGF
ncbi:hypothetical protein G4B88_005984 [Cannabis sativa]|uniref:Reverse transcriptase zinc-binding domain-containing protein n=1 Tax=Cannabis sativa TaxID=3483 RepID=A0A7J6IBY5_CANSA|nr:hypothetical protein G4B88_005984 [Cannabis sativa]